jgi:SAM-dependent methyltransferase
MPDEATLALMYGQTYFKAEGDQHVLPHDPGNRFADPIRWLKQNSPALLLDYGCGAGELLEQAQNLGWSCAGIEFDGQVAETVAKRLGVRILTNPIDLGADFQADVLHLGDVVEHLTDLNNQMPEILRLLKPGGILLAQGPLEANANLFTFLLKQSRKLRGSPVSTMPPFHVLLATAQGQRKFFERFGLREIEYKITETPHPAPEKIALADFKRPQKLSLFAVRRFSQILTSLNKKSWGNRYFYVGEKPKA